MRLLILSRTEAEKTLTWISDLKGLVSIHSPPESRLAVFEPEKTQPCVGFDDFSGPKIALGFDDAITKAENVFPMTEDQMSQLLRWGLDNEFDFDAEGSFIVHCGAGVARSSAAMFSLLARSSKVGDETACLARCYKASKDILPNTLMVQLADEALGRGGKMVQALKDWMKEAEEIG